MMKAKLEAKSKTGELRKVRGGLSFCNELVQD